MIVPTKKLHQNHKKPSQDTKQFKVRSISFQTTLARNPPKLSNEKLVQIDKKILKSKASRLVDDSYSNARALTHTHAPPVIKTRVRKELASQRRQLENLRLQDESQNTRLMKIQQEERQVNREYENQKQVMEKELEDLAQDAEIHNEAQQNMKKNLEDEDKQNIEKYDDKIKKQKEQMNKDKQKNEQLQDEIWQLEDEIRDHEEVINQQQEQIKKSKIYEDFLVQISEEFKEDEYQSGADSVLNKFIQLDKIQKDLTIDIQELEQKYNQKQKDIVQLNKEIEQLNLKGTSDMNKLKKDIESLIQENKKIENEFQGKEKNRLNNEIQQAQIIMAIKNIYYQYQAIPIIPENDEPDTNNLLEMLKQIENKITNLQDVEHEFKRRLYEQQQSMQQTQYA